MSFFFFVALEQDATRDSCPHFSSPSGIGNALFFFGDTLSRCVCEGEGQSCAIPGTVYSIGDFIISVAIFVTKVTRLCTFIFEFQSCRKVVGNSSFI